MRMYLLNIEIYGVKDMVMVQIDIQFLQLLIILVILKAKETQYKAQE